jgi:putative methyltransferase (TIGR01177 family)
MTLLCTLSQENLLLSKAEIEALYEKKGRLHDNLFMLDASEPIAYLAFTRAIYLVLFETSDLNRVAPRFPWHQHIDSPFAIEGNGIVDEKGFAAYPWRALETAGKEASVDLKHPQTTIALFKINDKKNEDEARIVVAKKLWENNDHFFDRRPHLRPRNHPTGLNPKLARAMVNLTGNAEQILDPFCGAGGILLEGALAQRKMTGIDIDPVQISRAEENLSHFNVAATLSLGDATQLAPLGSFDAIVTDLPLGKNAILKEAEATFTAFFKEAATVTTKMVVAIDVDFPLEKYFNEWTEQARFDWFIHKGMTKRLFLLER